MCILFIMCTCKISTITDFYFIISVFCFYLRWKAHYTTVAIRKLRTLADTLGKCKFNSIQFINFIPIALAVDGVEQSSG